MYYSKLYDLSIVDGGGVRVALYVSGCRNHCLGCHNKETWDFKYGTLYTLFTEKQIIQYLNHDYIKGFTVCGGEPMEEENQECLLGLFKKIKEIYPNKDIWVWTGYEFEDLQPNGKKYCMYTDELLSLIDVLVVGPFILNKRDISLNNLWRGSTNQQVIDVKKTLKENKLVDITFKQ